MTNKTAQFAQTMTTAEVLAASALCGAAAAGLILSVIDESHRLSRSIVGLAHLAWSEEHEAGHHTADPAGAYRTAATVLMTLALS